LKKPFTVKVPASSGNLGAGFDVLGLALNLHSELRVQVLNSSPGAPMIRVHGEGEAVVARDKRNLIYQCIEYVFKKAKRPVPRLELLCLNRIPLARGLGSSSAAIVAGLVAGNRLLQDKFSTSQLVAWATDIEGHADNVASAFFGGVVGNLIVENEVISRSWPVPNLKCVLAVPAFELSTKKARAVLPKAIPMKDAVANIAAISMLNAALAGDYALLKGALSDRLHEPYRAKLIPGFYAVKSAAEKAGAYGTALSGAGPSILALADRRHAKRVGAAMVAAFKRARVNSKVLILDIDKKGVIVR
jgi:homoserine kinase